MNSRRQNLSSLALGGLMLFCLQSCAASQQVQRRAVPPATTRPVQFTLIQRANVDSFDVRPEVVEVYPGDLVRWQVSPPIGNLIDWELDLQPDPTRASPATTRHVRPAAGTPLQGNARIRLDAGPGDYKYSITVRIPNPNPTPGPGTTQYSELLVTVDPIIRIKPD